MSNQIYIVGYR